MNRGIFFDRDGVLMKPVLHSKTHSYGAAWKDKVDGFTSNPSLMKKGGVTDYEKFAKEVLSIIGDKPISFEVLSDDLNEMERQACKISSWGKNIYVKIPITNTQGISTAPIIKKLSEDGIKLNITAILTYPQVAIAYSALSPRTPAIISIFAGRIADTGIDPSSLIKSAIYTIVDKPNIQLLWTSTREIFNIVQAKNYGCDIITVTPEILKKKVILGKDLTELSLETVKQFYEDAKGLIL